MPAQDKSRKTLNINLLPQDTFEKTTLGKFVKWALSVGRYIVVFTELIVILAFLSRFKLDRDLTDIHESIEQKKAIVNSAALLEKQIRNLQDYLKKVAETEKKQRPYSSFMTSFTQIIPQEVTIENFSLKENLLSLSCLSQTTRGIGSFIYQLKNSPKYSQVTVDNISRETNSPIEFNLTLVLTEKAFE